MGEKSSKMKPPLASPTFLKCYPRVAAPLQQTGWDQTLKDLLYILRQVCQTPVAFVTFLHDQQQSVQLKVGLTKRQVLQYKVLSDWTSRQVDGLVIPDLLQDQRFREILLSQSPPNSVSVSSAVSLKTPTFRFYAGSPIISPAGVVVGAVSVMDKIPRQLSQPQQQALQTIAMQMAAQLNYHHLVNVVDNWMGGVITLDADGCITYANSQAAQLWQRPQENLVGTYIGDEFPHWKHSSLLDRCVTEAGQLHFQFPHPQFGRWLEAQVYPHGDGLAVYLNPLVNPPSDTMMTEQTHLWALGGAIGIALAQGSPLSDVLVQCTQAMTEHIQAISAQIWLHNGTTGQLKLEALSGQLTQADNKAGETSLIQFIAKNQQPLCGQLRSLSGQLKTISGQATATTRDQSLEYFIGYPLIIERRVVGVMALYHDQPLTETTRQMLEWVATSIAISIDRAWVREALLKRREGLLFRLANQIRNSLDLNTILETAVHEIRNLLQIDRCHFLWYLPHPETPSLMVTHEARKNELPSLLAEDSTQELDFLADKIQNMELLRVNDLDQEGEIEPLMQQWMKSLGITSQLLLPLETRSGQLGAIVCSHCSGPRPWSDSEVELLQAVVNQLAIAIDQAELYAQTHAAALAAQTQAQQLSEALHNLKQTQAQLVQSEKMSSLGQMVAGVAHEINNPVNFIYGNLTYANSYIKDILSLLDLYQEHYPNPVPAVRERLEDVDLAFLVEDLPKILSSMEMGADRIRQIVLSLRNFSRLDEAEKKLVNIHDGLDNTLLILHNRLKSKGTQSGIEVKKHYGNIPQLDCYAGQMNQVFMNILANAIDALEGHRDPRMITITTGLLDRQGNWLPADSTSHVNATDLVIRIQDNGPGMNEQVRQHLFDPFFTTKPVGKERG
jgi:two-component system NtrC family sensor kinase